MSASLAITQQKKGFLVMGNDGFTVTEAAKRLKVPKSTLRSWINDGLFPNVRKKNPYAKTSPFLIPEEDLENFLENKKAWSV